MQRKLLFFIYSTIAATAAARGTSTDLYPSFTVPSLPVIFSRPTLMAISFPVCIHAWRM